MPSSTTSRSSAPGSRRTSTAAREREGRGGRDGEGDSAHRRHPDPVRLTTLPAFFVPDVPLLFVALAAATVVLTIVAVTLLMSRPRPRAAVG